MYSRQIEGRTYDFGVSGLLYHSNVLMYDRQTESLWSQIKRQAVTGRLSGARLETFPSTLTTWRKWQQKFPQTRVLTTNTGHVRNYNRDPYEDYYQSSRGLFGFFNAGPGEEEKALVVGVEREAQTAAYPLELLRRVKKIEDKLGGKPLVLSYREADDQIEVLIDGKVVPSLVTYWFVWKGFHPKSGLYPYQK